MSAVIMAFYLEELASDYLTNTMQAGLDLALNLDGDLGLEGAHTTDEVQRILANLTHVCSEFVNSICQSTCEVPEILSYVTFLMHQAMAPYPEHNKKVLSSFLVRRFFCPALVRPEDYLLEEDSGELSKQVMNAFKVAVRALESMADGEQLRTKAVSYTHLTLPTIRLV